MFLSPNRHRDGAHLVHAGAEEKETQGQDNQEGVDLSLIFWSLGCQWQYPPSPEICSSLRATTTTGMCTPYAFFCPNLNPFAYVVSLYFPFSFFDSFFFHISRLFPFFIPPTQLSCHWATSSSKEKAFFPIIYTGLGYRSQWWSLHKITYGYIKSVFWIHLIFYRSRSYPSPSDCSQELFFHLKHNITDYKFS